MVQFFALSVMFAMIDPTLVQTFTGFTNALLAAILPQVSDFCQNTDLGVPLPVSSNQISVYKVNNDLRALSATVVLTNGFIFGYDYGIINYFKAPDSEGVALNLRSPTPADPSAAQAEAVKLGREWIRRLGYGEKELYVNLDPQVQVFKLKQLYELDWARPQDAVGASVVLRIHLPTKRLLNASFYNYRARRVNSIAIPPELKPPLPSGPRIKRNRRITGSENAHIAEKILPSMGEFIRRLKIPIAEVSTNLIREIELFDCAGVPKGEITLTNGYSFWVLGERIGGFSAPEEDVFFDVTKEVDLDHFVGTPKYNEGEAIRLIKEALTRLGYKPIELGMGGKPNVLKPRAKPLNVSRLGFLWTKPMPGFHLVEVEAEIETERGELKRLTLPWMNADADFHPSE
jgi:hypothetical protein